MRFYLRIVVTVLLIWRVALTITLAVIGRYDLTMYTYWQNTMVVVFYILLWIALWFERGILTFTTLFVFPIPLGTVFLVAVSIVIIIQENEDVFTAGTSSGLALSLIHTGDWILHSLPLIEILLILGLGWLLYARAIIASEISSIAKSEWRAAYILYWLLVPLVPLLIYCLIWDIAVQYPTGIPTYILWLGLFALNFVWMTVWYFAFTSSANVGISVYSFFGHPPVAVDPVVVSASLNTKPPPPRDIVVRPGAYYYDEPPVTPPPPQPYYYSAERVLRL